MSEDRIAGGMSTPGCVRFLSREFTATARYNEKNGTITCTVKRNWWLAQALHENKCWPPVPRLMRLIVLTGNMLTIMERILFVAYFPLSMLLVAVLDAVGVVKEDTWEQYYSTLLVLTIVTVMVFVNLFIATWHAAEHKTFAAYERTDMVDLSAIKQESRVHDKCGGRLMLPFVVGLIVADIVAKYLGINELLCSLVALELVLWVDALKGWDTIPLTLRASHLLQWHCTTRNPGEQELRTAHRALQALLDVHRNEKV